MQLSKPHLIEKLVRGKNEVYRKWRRGKSWEQLDSWCAECLFRFGTLPYWLEYAQARRARDWTQAGAYEQPQREWRNKIRTWCLERGITSFANQSAQFYKYYSAWYRVQQEERHGKIERQYARQMY